jgi:hypothetical protein
MTEWHHADEKMPIDWAHPKRTKAAQAITTFDNSQLELTTA